MWDNTRLNMDTQMYHMAVAEWHIADHHVRSPYTENEFRWHCHAKRDKYKQLSSECLPRVLKHYARRPIILTHRGDIIDTADWAWLHLVQAAQNRALRYKRTLP